MRYGEGGWDSHGRRDFAGEFEAVVDRGEDPSVAQSGAAIRQRTWLTRRNGARMGWQPRKRHRVSAFKWGLTFDHQLQMGTGSFGGKCMEVEIVASFATFDVLLF